MTRNEELAEVCAEIDAALRCLQMGSAVRDLLCRVLTVVRPLPDHILNAEQVRLADAAVEAHTQELAARVRERSWQFEVRNNHLGEVMQ